MFNPASSSFEEFVTRQTRSSDLLAQFNTRSVWYRRDDRTDDLDLLLQPHSETFFSCLRPLFLHQIKSLDAISYFAPVLCKDGLLPLMSFFKRYPVPPPSDQKLLLVHSRFAFFIPEAWSSSVAFYEPISHHTGAHSNSKSIYIILTILDERQCTLSYAEAQLQAFREQMQLETQRPTLRIVILYNGLFHSNVPGNDRKSEHLFQLLQLIQKTTGCPVSYARWSDLLHADLSHSIYLDLNEINFYYSYSFVTHHFMSRGSLPFEAPPERQRRAPAHDSESPIQIPGSLNHSYRVFALDPAELPQLKEKRRELEARITAFCQTQAIREEEAQFVEESAVLFGKKFGSLSFELMIYQLGREVLCT